MPSMWRTPTKSVRTIGLCCFDSILIYHLHLNIIVAGTELDDKDVVEVVRGKFALTKLDVDCQ